MAKSPAEMERSMIENLKANTGKTLEQWLKLVGKSLLAKHGEIVKWLKADHGMTHGYANLVAHKHLKSDAGSSPGEDDLVAGLYSGAKAELRPIYDELLKQIQKFGKDVEIAPKKAYVSLRRNKQFGLIQPSTKTRVDVGINCKDLDVTERLEASGSFNSMVSHRVRITSIDEVDKELVAWLKKAYSAS